MSKNTRTDAHRPSTIIPAHYAERMWYSLAHEFEGWPQPPINVDRVVEITREARAAGHAVFGGIGKCGVCGAWFKHGTLFVHEPTGELVHMGYDCAAKYECMVDASAAELERDRVHRATAKQITRERNDAERAAFLDAHEGLAADLEYGKVSAKDAGIAEDDYRALKTHAILADLASKFTRFRTMSDKQVALARKLADELRNPEPREVEIKTTAPTGKGVTFEGEIVSVKLHVSEQWGSSWKCTVKIETPDGIWLAWGSLASNMVDLARESTEYREAERSSSRDRSNAIEGAMRAAMRGLRVSVKATLEAGTDRECGSCQGEGSWLDSDYDADGKPCSTRTTCKHCNGTGVKRADKSFAFMKRPSMSVAGLYVHPKRKAPKKVKCKECGNECLVSRFTYDVPPHGGWIVCTPNACSVVREDLDRDGCAIEGKERPF